MTSLSVVIPAYNEETRLPLTLESVASWLDHRGLTFAEVVVVDDGSSDGTARLVEEFRAVRPQVRLIRNPGNCGKGYAVRNGMLQAQGAWRLVTDADLSSPIEEADKLFAAAEKDAAEIAIGSRALDRSLIAVHQSAFREGSGRFFNVIMRAVTGLPFHDTQCGFKLFSAYAAGQIFPRQQLNGFSFDVEDLFIAQRRGIPVVEVPVRWSNVEGTKVSMAHGLRSFADLIRIRTFAAEGKYD